MKSVSDPKQLYVNKDIKHHVKKVLIIGGWLLWWVYQVRANGFFYFWGDTQFCMKSFVWKAISDPKQLYVNKDIKLHVKKSFNYWWVVAMMSVSSSGYWLLLFLRWYTIFVHYLIIEEACMSHLSWVDGIASPSNKFDLDISPWPLWSWPWPLWPWLSYDGP